MECDHQATKIRANKPEQEREYNHQDTKVRGKIQTQRQLAKKVREKPGENKCDH